MKIFLSLLLLAMLACYAPGLSSPPAYDDATTVLMNPKMLDDRALAKGFVDPTERTLHGVRLPSYPYRPLTEWTLGINLRLARHSILGLRLGNLLIHAAAVVLAFLLVRRLAGEGSARWASAFLALHPLGVQAVTYVSQRSTGLEAALALGACLLYLRGPLWGAWILAFLAIGAKETAATIPLVLGILELSRPDRSWRRWLLFLVPPAVLAVQVWRASVAERAATGVDLFGEGGMGPLRYLSHELPVLWHYVRITFWPFPMRFCYDRALEAPSFLPAALGWLAVLAWLVLGPARHRTARLGAALFLAPLALESTVFPRAETAWGYRVYPALLGAGIGFSLLPRLVKVPALALLALLCIGDNRTWAAPRALAGRDVRHAVHKPEIWGAYAWNRLEAGRPERAERLSARAARLPWQDFRNLSAGVQALLAQGKSARAGIEALGRMFPGRPETLWLRVQAGGVLPEEIAALPEPDAQSLLWAVRRETARGRWKEAEALLRRREAALALHPVFWDHLGQVLLGQGRDADAEAAYRKALALEANLPKARNNLGLILYRRGDLEGAAREFEKALSLKPDYALAAKNLDRVRKAR